MSMQRKLHYSKFNRMISRACHRPFGLGLILCATATYSLDQTTTVWLTCSPHDHWSRLTPHKKQSKYSPGRHSASDLSTLSGTPMGIRAAGVNPMAKNYS